MNIIKANGIIVSNVEEDDKRIRIEIGIVEEVIQEDQAETTEKIVGILEEIEESIT